MPLTVKHAPNTSVFMRQGHILVGAYKSDQRRKPVRVISTEATVMSLTGKPHVISNYNTNMGGVDEADKLLSFYNAERKTLKVWKKVAFNLIFRLMLNAYVLYSKNTSDRPIKSRLRFIQECVASLAEDQIRARRANHNNRAVRKQLKRLPGNN